MGNQKITNTLGEFYSDTEERVEIFFDLSEVDKVVFDLSDTEMIEKFDETIYEEVGCNLVDAGLKMDFVFALGAEEVPEDFTPEDIESILSNMNENHSLGTMYSSDKQYYTVFIAGTPDVVTQEHIEVVAATVTKEMGIIPPIHVTRAVLKITPNGTEELSKSAVVKAKKKLKETQPSDN